MSKIQVGLDKLHYAPVTKDDATGVSYGAMEAIPNIQSLGIAVERSEGQAYADDKLAESFSSISAYTVTLGLLGLDEKTRAFLMGHTYDEATQTVIEKTTDVAPEIGLAFRSMNSDGSYKYVKLLKGKFSATGDNFATKGDSVEFQSKEIEGKFLARIYDDALKISSQNPADGATWFTSFGDTPVA